jgi:CRP-like cAMP-binding protein
VQSALFGSLDPGVLRRLLNQVEVIDLAPGGQFFRQGDPSDRLCVVVEGAVVPVAEEARRTRLSVLESGDFFGEIGLLADQPRNATVEALVETRLLAFDRPLVWKLLREHGPMLGVLLRALRERLIDRLVRTSPFFAVFAKASRNAVARQFRLLEVRENAIVIQQGLTEQGLFVVLAGELDVIAEGVDGDKTLAMLQAGEIFGEMSTLYQQPAIATVMARKKCWLLGLSSARFAKILKRNPRLAEMLRRIAQERDHQNRAYFYTNQPIRRDL